LSPILEIMSSYAICLREKGTYQHPPGASRRSKTRMRSNAFSLARASIVMAPAGPVPMIATRLTVTILSNNGEILESGHAAYKYNINKQNER
jgi:hypothetical protein